VVIPWKIAVPVIQAVIVANAEATTVSGTEKQLYVYYRRVQWCLDGPGTRHLLTPDSVEVLPLPPTPSQTHTKSNHQRRLQSTTRRKTMQGLGGEGGVIHTEYRAITPNSYFQLVVTLPILTASSHVRSTSCTVCATLLRLLPRTLLVPVLVSVSVGRSSVTLLRSKSPLSSRIRSNASSSRKALSGTGDEDNSRPRPAEPFTKEGRRKEPARRVVLGERPRVLDRLLLSLSLLPLLWEEAMLADEGRRGVDSVSSGGIVILAGCVELEQNWNKGLRDDGIRRSDDGREGQETLVSADFDPCGLIGSMQARSPGNLARTILLSKSLLGSPCTLPLCGQTSRTRVCSFTGDASSTESDWRSQRPSFLRISRE